MRELTSEEILAKCPETIDPKSIRLHKTGGAPRTGGGSRKLKWWKEEDRIKAACTYAIVGTAAKTEEITGIPAGTIRQWRTQPWWPQITDRIKQEHDDELDVKFTSIIDKTVSVINDRLQDGDYIYDTKNSEFKRKPVGAKETAVITSIFMDKRQMLRDNRKLHSETTAVLDRLKKLADEMARFGKAKEVKTVSPEIEAEDAEVITEDDYAVERDAIQESDTEMSGQT